MGHAGEDDGAQLVHSGAATGRGEDGGAAGGLAASEAEGWNAAVVAGGGGGTVHARTPFDDVELELEDALFAEDPIGRGNDG